MADYPNTQLYIDGQWTDGQERETLPVVGPATGLIVGRVAAASAADVDRAAISAADGFAVWRNVPAIERAAIMRRAAVLLRSQIEPIATLMTIEQGKPLHESRAELQVAADVIDWFAGEAPRAYGRVIPARATAISQTVLRQPVGPVAAFSPWNFPINQIVRKISAALAAGCSIIATCPSETPASPAALLQAFVEAGVPTGVVTLLYGDPAMISGRLIPSPHIRKITFTGSTAVGKLLAGMAGQHMKRATMELGGHAPVIVTNTADVSLAVRVLSAAKFRNAGQVCISPTRFLIQEDIYDQFAEAFTVAAGAIVVGPGLADGVQMGPLANERRLHAMQTLVADALDQGARLATGGRRFGETGFFFEPTVLDRVPATARVMNDEPFGPIATLAPFRTLAEAIDEANRLPYALASYAYTSSLAEAQTLTHAIEAGMVSINGAALALPETPNGGLKDSGYGAEGGTEGIDPYLITKFATYA